MKIIKKGKDISDWWVGIEIPCPRCDQVVKLEENDYNHPTLKISNDSNLLAYRCMNCDFLNYAGD